jgi:hypothetical protein
MATMPPSVPPTAGAMTELCLDVIQCEMVKTYLGPTEQQEELVM